MASTLEVVSTSPLMCFYQMGVSLPSQEGSFTQCSETGQLQQRALSSHISRGRGLQRSEGQVAGGCVGTLLGVCRGQRAGVAGGCVGTLLWVLVHGESYSLSLFLRDIGPAREVPPS